MSSDRLKSFEAFWPFYLGEHRLAATRWMHFSGTTVVVLLLLSALVTGRWSGLWVLPIVGYGPAWVSHFFIERNRPASFKYPLWSLAADFKMWALMLTGRLGSELRRAGV